MNESWGALVSRVNQDETAMLSPAHTKRSDTDGGQNKPFGRAVSQENGRLWVVLPLMRDLVCRRHLRFQDFSMKTGYTRLARLQHRDYGKPKSKEKDERHLGKLVEYSMVTSWTSLFGAIRPVRIQQACSFAGHPILILVAQKKVTLSSAKRYQQQSIIAKKVATAM